ncbi:large ribosomal subunit protein mL65 [Cylas formicarius]|uniref:large ribosomal subunit protein mL65 n=1 Tax=Cylas formicarius TaxID=197179 RepID=UPI0029583997|nr:large ribosomal subunit protein mL65 [Cylas formicarius]
MGLIRLKRNVALKLLNTGKALSNVATQNDEEYTDVPEYPPILDLSIRKRLERKKETRHDMVRAVKTVEEKQIKLNMPRYYGFKSYMLFEEKIPYNGLCLSQYVTRTHLINELGLPNFYENINSDGALDLAGDIQECLLMEIDYIQRLYDIKKEEITNADRENLTGAAIAKQINRIISNNLAPKYNHIVDSQADIAPRIESCWYAGGMDPPNHIKRMRSKIVYKKEFENDPIDRLMYYIGSPLLSVRSRMPLLPIMSHSEAENPEFEIPHFKYDPRVLGIPTEYRHVANIPGFWPGDPNMFGLVSFHKRGHIEEHLKQFKDPKDTEEAIHRQAILASYAWLHAQANFLGFTTFNDITYPLVTQTVITNGKQWSFYVYQLNTIKLHNTAQENPKKNVCWATGQMNLFEEINEDKIVGFNEDTLKLLVKFYANAPQERLAVNMRPYLSNEEKLAADYQDDDKRQWLEREYKYLVANRPRLKEVDEIYSWEKIYKIDHKTRPLEKRLRPFELLKNPYKRALNHRLPRYIPKALRPDLPKHKGRRAKEYFP